MPDKATAAANKYSALFQAAIPSQKKEKKNFIILCCLTFIKEDHLPLKGIWILAPGKETKRGFMSGK